MIYTICKQKIVVMQNIYFSAINTLLAFWKARVGSALFASFAEVNVMYIPQDPPGATCADLLAASMQSVTSPHASV